MYFYVHSNVLLRASGNGFNSMLPIFGPASFLLSECLFVLAVMIGPIYKWSCTQYFPTFHTVVEVINALKKYGVPPQNVIAPSTPLYHILLTHASAQPLNVFALAAQHDLHDLAVTTSSYLLSFPLSTISDKMAEQIGPIYLKRLFFMHLGRAEVLRSIILPPPYPHILTKMCDYGQQT